MSRSAWRALLLLGCATWQACGTERDTSPLADSPAAASLEPVADIQPFRHIDFETVNDIRWLGDSSLALIDMYGASVVIRNIHTGEGRVVGRKGEGPGELLYPVRMGVMHQSAPAPMILVADSKTQRLSVFDATTGDFESAHRIRGMPLVIHGVHENKVFMSALPFSGRAGPELVTIDLANDSLETRFRYLAASDRLSQHGGRFLAITGQATGPFYAASGAEYRIVVFDSTGAITAVAERPHVEPTYPTEADVERHRAALEEAAERVGRAVVESALNTYRTNPLPFVSLTGLATDDDGWLWVVRLPGAAASSTLLDLFDAKGTFVQSLRVPDRVQALDFHGELVAFLVERADGPWADLPSVDVYRVGKTLRCKEC